MSRCCARSTLRVALALMRARKGKLDALRAGMRCSGVGGFKISSWSGPFRWHIASRRDRNQGYSHLDVCGNERKGQALFPNLGTCCPYLSFSSRPGNYESSCHRAFLGRDGPKWMLGGISGGTAWLPKSDKRHSSAFCFPETLDPQDRWKGHLGRDAGKLLAVKAGGRCSILVCRYFLCAKPDVLCSVFLSLSPKSRPS